MGKAAPEERRSGSRHLSSTDVTSLPSISIVFSPMSELQHEIPHMPLIWNEAAQERSYLTAVEFSTLASNVSPEAIKKKKRGVGCIIGSGKWGDSCLWLKTNAKLASVYFGRCLAGFVWVRMER